MARVGNDKMKIFWILRHPGTWKIFRFDDRLMLIIFGAITGMTSGLAAVILNRSLLAMLNTVHDYRHFWWAFLLPASGAALSSLFLNKVVKESPGHGVPEVIYSVHRHGGLLRFRSSFSRLISCCLTIGSGGSAGPEAPVVMSGSAIGSNIAKFFSLNDRQRISLVGCGAAGAISSIFNAPVAGFVFSMEVILGQWSAVNIIPVAIASVAGTEISRLLQGNQIVFSHRGFEIGFVEITASIGLAVIAAMISVFLTRFIGTVHNASQRISAPKWCRAAIGGAAVGLIGLYMPVVLGEGYHAIHSMIESQFTPGLVIVIIACIAKIAATSLTLGSGGSGGIFAPSLVIGSFAGLAYHRFLMVLFPSLDWVNEGCFALLGMAGLISGMLQAPLTGIFLIVEITGGYEVMLPLIIVSAISTTASHYIEPASFYLKDLVGKGWLLPPGTDGRVLSDLSVKELLETDCIAVPQNLLLRDFIPVVAQSNRNYFPVEDSVTGRYLGMIHIDDIRPYLFNPGMYDAVILDQIKNSDMDTVSLSDDLLSVLDKMDAKGMYSIPVVENHRFLGLISKATLLDQYRKELRVQTTAK